MRNHIRKIYFLPLLLMALIAACSEPQQDTDTSAGSTASRPAGAQNGTPAVNPATSATPTATPNAQTSPAEAPAKSANAATKPGEKPAGQPTLKGTPRLDVPVKKIDFGKQPKERTLSRTFVVRNTGSAELKIEAVEPS